jgi:hypothetical protein
MTRNMLKNTADTLCHMFCGWRQTALLNLGSERTDLELLEQ